MTTILCIILAVLAAGFALALFFQLKAAKEQAEEGEQLLNDYQKRVNEIEKLLSDYQQLQQKYETLEKNSEKTRESVKKLQDERATLAKANEALERQGRELREARSRLEGSLMRKKGLIEQTALAIKQKLDFSAPAAAATAQLVSTIQNINDVELETAIDREDNITASDIVIQAVRETAIDKATYLDFRHFITDEAQITMLLTNEAQVVRALTNLLDNAMKFTTSGSVTLFTATDGTNLTFTVEDTGTGIPADDVEKIFEPFVKLNTYFDGNGIGLTVARSIARRLGGDVTLDTTYTTGARLILTLPI